MKTKLLLTAAAILWGTLHTHAATAEPDVDTKKQYTRTLYTKNQETIQERARICGGIHDMYAMLALLHVNVLKPTVTWNVVDFLLQTAGHWGWGTSGKTASAAETLIYREAAICRFWEEPKLAAPSSAPLFLQQVKADAMVFHRINNQVAQIINRVDLPLVASLRRWHTSKMMEMQGRSYHDIDMFVIGLYLDECQKMAEYLASLNRYQHMESMKSLTNIPFLNGGMDNLL